MKRLIVVLILLGLIAGMGHSVSPTKYTAQQVLNMAFLDSDGNPLSFSTQLSMQNVLCLAFDDTENVLNAKIVGEFVISTITNVASIYWLDGSTWTSTKINMGGVSLEYTNYQIAVNTDTWVMGDFFWGAAGTKSTGTAEGSLSIHLNLTVREHTYTGSLTVGGTTYHGDNVTIADTKTFDGRDVSVDGADLDQVQIDTETSRVAIADNKAVLEELSSSTLELYYTNEVSPSVGYLLMMDTIPTGAESTITSAMDSATVVVTTFTVETVLGLSALRKGLYHSHFHAEMNNTNRDVRLRFEVWNGTGTGETFLFSSEQSDLITADKVAYNIHVSTNEIITTVNYPAIRIVADVIGAAAAPILTFYMEGTNSSLFEMPVLLSDVGVTKIIAGTNINISPSDGRGEVTANVDDPPTFTNIKVGLDIEGVGDPNTKMRYGTDSLSLEAGGKKFIQGVESTIDIVYLGDGTWAYMLFGDTTNAMVEISSYVYATKTWQIRNLKVFYGGLFSTMTVLGKATIKEMELTDGATMAGQLKVKQITSGDVGSTDDVWQKFVSSDSWGEPVAGAGGGNKNAEYPYDAGQFTLPNIGGASPYKFEYEIGTTSYPANELRFSTATDNSAFIKEAFDNEYDGGNITFKIHYYTDSTTVGDIEFNVEVTTATDWKSTKWDNNAFGLFSSHAVAYETKIATLTITTNKPVANKPYRMRLWVDVSDTTYVSGDIKVLKMVIDYDKN